MHYVGQHDEVMLFGHTSKGTKPCCPAYVMSCVIQKAANKVGAGWRMRHPGDLACYRQAKPQLCKMSPESLMKPDPSVTLSPSTTHIPHVTFDNSRPGE